MKIIVDRRTKLYKLPPITLTSLKSFPNYMAKTIINNLNKGAKDLLKMLCENYTNITNDVKKLIIIVKI